MSIECWCVAQSSFGQFHRRINAFEQHCNETYHDKHENHLSVTYTHICWRPLDVKYACDLRAMDPFDSLLLQRISFHCCEYLLLWFVHRAEYANYICILDLLEFVFIYAEFYGIHTFVSAERSCYNCGQ